MTLKPSRAKVQKAPTAKSGSISTNIYLRRIHNFALDMNWLP